MKRGSRIVLDGKAIRKMRREKGLRQRDLAERIGTYQAAISRIERNEPHSRDDLKRAIKLTLESETVRGDLVLARAKFPKLADREWLKQKLSVEGLTYQKVADLVGCSRQGVHKRARQFGLRRRKKPIRLKAVRKTPRRQIALKGLLKNKRLRAVLNGKLYIARVFPSGAIKRIDTGEVFDHPTDAAKAICNRQVSGWAFWKYKAGKSLWVPLGKLKAGKAHPADHRSTSRR